MEPQKNHLNSASEQGPKGASLEVEKNADLPLMEAVSSTVQEMVGDLPSENASSSPKPASQAAKKMVTPEERKAQLLASLPESERRAKQRMVGDIENVVNQQLKALKKEEANASSAYELNMIMQKIRGLYHILEELAEAGFEYLKNLWLRMVHGLTI